MSITVQARTSGTRPGRQLARAALGVAAFALASSVLATPRPARPAGVAPEPAPTPVQVVLVVLDGARFREIYGGVDAELAKRQQLPASRIVDSARLMPNLHRLMTRDGAALGVPDHGASISASGPEFVSLPGYSEIFTGRRVSGCWNNGCPGTVAPSVADELAQEAAAHWKTAVVTSWPDIARVAAKTEGVAVSAGRHAGATRAQFERQRNVAFALHRAEDEAPWPGHDDFRRDRFTAELALSYLKAQAPNFLFVGLGETDEFAHQNDYAGYLDALTEADRYIGELSDVLAARERLGVRTALLVTADHGRSAGFREHGKPYPESARVWLVASGSAIAARGFTAAPSARRLADIAPTLRSLFGLPADHDENAGTTLLELFAAAHK